MHLLKPFLDFLRSVSLLGRPALKLNAMVKEASHRSQTPPRVFGIDRDGVKVGHLGLERREHYPKFDRLHSIK